MKNLLIMNLKIKKKENGLEIPNDEIEYKKPDLKKNGRL